MATIEPTDMDEGSTMHAMLSKQLRGSEAGKGSESKIESVSENIVLTGQSYKKTLNQQIQMTRRPQEEGREPAGEVVSSTR